MTDSSSIFQTTGLSLPALRGQQGSRTLYLTLPSNAVLNNFFPIDMEPADDRSQRALDAGHARQIAQYITSNPTEYALGAITYAVDLEGSFTEVEKGSNIGLLRLPLNARLRSIDGQHRREGIRLAIDAVQDLGSQSTALLIYVEHDLAKRRQMFSDMNNTARKVSKALNVSYDTRDPFARVAAELADNHPLLEGRVDREGSRTQPGDGNLFTLAALHDALKRLFVGGSGRVKDSARFDEDQIRTRGSVFFDALLSARPELRPGVTAEELEETRSRSILLSSTTLRVVAASFWAACEATGVDALAIGGAFSGFLSDLDFSPSADLWIQSGFVSPGRATPNARSQEMRAAAEVIADLLIARVHDENGVS
ncbi:DGQHR domain-containing protein [Glaciihabitans arcticus]|uniref:DGQHR domain-containing protein n=1 Tax=Glaciihabitans arcticus TaxID=2668039 RepID=A0A4Q9GW56_9MICO|nr:DNA sulfur modification protein DndB [Glaciihabitans arcticus]TBN57437.1 DGQHR domain-containing protein [Glaciihabitans arcticus]